VITIDIIRVVNINEVISMEKITETEKYWLVVHSQVTGDFKNATMLAAHDEDIEEVAARFEQKNPEYRVIHIGEGELPPKTYRPLEYIQ
jgi:hypothetical protein